MVYPILHVRIPWDHTIVSVTLDTRKTHQICVEVRHNFVYTIKSAHADTSIKETPVLKGQHFPCHRKFPMN